VEKLIRPALEGVTNVLAAVDRVGGVKRVVITSSISAIVGDHYERGRWHVYNEDDWDLSATDTFLPYHRCAFSEATALVDCFQSHTDKDVVPAGIKHIGLGGRAPLFPSHLLACRYCLI
jgi:nucleoside-diphosphate-sugar epimerase